ncbi:MAG: hypothetical protein AB8B82_01580 [Roseovarius sp.]
MRHFCLALGLGAVMALPAAANTLRDTADRIAQMGTHAGAPIGLGEKLYRSTMTISDDCMMTGEQRSDIRANPPSPALLRYTVPVAQINPDKVNTLAADNLLILSFSVPKGTKGHAVTMDITKSNPMIGRARDGIASGREQGQCNTSGCRLDFNSGFVELALVGKTKTEARRLAADVKQLIELCKK